MKKLAAQSSPQQHSKKDSGNDLLAVSKPGFNKSFRKRYKVQDSSTINSSSNLVKNFSKTKISQLYVPRESPKKQLERRSNSKAHISKPIQKISLTSYAYHQSNSLPTTTKLLRINSIFTHKGKLCPKQTLMQLYEQNDEYMQMLEEWQKLQIYDQVDKLVYKLSQNYIKIIEQVIYQAYQEIDAKLQKYQQQIKSLEEHNLLLKQINQQNRINWQLVDLAQNQFIEEYNKNQWSNLILEQIRKNNFDLDQFVQQTPIFKYLTSQQSKAAKNIAQNYFHAHKQLYQRQLRVTKSEVKLNEPMKERTYSVQHEKEYHQ